jgi:hypothetical protein
MAYMHIRVIVSDSSDGFILQDNITDSWILILNSLTNYSGGGVGGGSGGGWFVKYHM